MTAPLERASCARISPFIASIFLLAGCGEGREPDPTPIRDGPPVSRVEAVPTPVPAAIPEPGYPDGVWRQTILDGSPALVFGPAAGEGLARLYCDGRGGAVVERLGEQSIGDINMMEVRAGTEVARLALNEVETQEPILRSSIPFNHSLMTALAKPEGALFIKAGETPALQAPLNARTAEMIARCETPQPRTG